MCSDLSRSVAIFCHKWRSSSISGPCSRVRWGWSGRSQADRCSVFCDGDFGSVCIRGEVSWDLLARRRMTHKCWRDYISDLAWERLGFCQNSWTRWLGRGKSGLPCYSRYARNLTNSKTRVKFFCYISQFHDWRILLITTITLRDAKYFSWVGIRMRWFEFENNI